MGKKVRELSPHQAKIIFLGTGQGSLVLGKHVRLAGGIIVQTHGNQLLLDPGPGSLTAASVNNVNLRETTSILVSHNHLNHCNDVNAVIDAMTYSGFDRQGVLIANRTLVNGSDEQRPYLTDYHRNLLEKVMVVNQGQRVAVNEVEIHALPAYHTDPNSVGYRITSPSFTLVYSGDTEHTPDLYEHYKDADILILNVPYPDDESEGGNLCTADAVNIIKAVRPRLSVLTHFSVKMLNADPLNEAREVQKKTGCQVIAAKDNLSINPKSYSEKP